jgi:hypothetical protein
MPKKHTIKLETLVNWFLNEKADYYRNIFILF